MTLAHFLSEQGIATYEGLKVRCSNIGVDPPSVEIFELARGPVVSSPAEGIVVLEHIVTNDEPLKEEARPSSKKKRTAEADRSANQGAEGDRADR